MKGEKRDFYEEDADMEALKKDSVEENEACKKESVEDHLRESGREVIASIYICYCLWV